MSLAYGSNDRPHHLDLSGHPQPPSSTLSSATLAYVILVLLLIYHALQYFDYLSLRASELLWNAFIYLTPLSVISALDARSEPRLHQGKKAGYEAPASEKHATKSEVMRRILGLDGTGILTAVQRTRTVSGLGTLFQSRPSGSPPGLGNWDNSCYQNSVIQGLASLPSLSTFLGNITKVDQSHSTQAALGEIISKLNDPSNAGKLFWTPTGLKSMSSWQQQDAQEYFSKIMDNVEREISKTIKSKSKHAGLALEAAQELRVSTMKIDDAVEKSEAHNILSSSKTSIDQLPDELGSVIARSPLVGLQAQRVGCLTCGYVEGLSVVPFTCLTVPLGKQWMYDIRTCLDEYTNLEPINGVECVKCTLLHNKKQLERLRSQFYNQDTGDPNPLAPPLSSALLSSIEDRLAAVDLALDEEDFSDNAILKKCQIPARSRISTTKSRQAVIARAPQALVVHVNRSIFNELSGVQSKNLADVRFPVNLDIAPWCLGNSPPAKSDDPVEPESWNVDPSVSMLPAEADSKNLNCKEMYELRAVITHYGRHENGHYICYRRHSSASDPVDGAADPWWRFSDDEVSQVREENVLSQGGVFMLFYEKSKLQKPKGGERGVPEPEASIAADIKPEQVQVDSSLEETKPGTPREPTLTNDSACDAISTETPSNASEIVNTVPVAEKLPEYTAALPPIASSATSSEALTTPPAPKTSHSPPSPFSNPQTPTSPPPPHIPYTPQEPSQAPSSPSSTSPLPPPTTTTPPHPFTNPLDTPQDKPQEPRKLAPPPMRTAGPRSGRGGNSRAGKAMGMGMGGGMVEAN